MRRLVLAIALTALPFAGAAQAPVPPPVAQGPTLRAAVDQVVVDVVVTDAAGKVVTGLTAADFEVRERDRVQTVTTFDEVSVPAEPRPLGQKAPNPGDVRSNARVRDARVFILVLDDANVSIDLTPVVHRAARYFLHRYVQPGDLVSVVTTTGLGDTRQEPTEDLALIEGAIERFAGHGSDVTSMASAQRAIAANANRNADPMKVRRTSTTLIDDGSVDDKDDVADEARERARLTLRTLETAATSFIDVPGRRKTLIFFSSGSPIAAINNEFTDLRARVLAAAARANATIYALDPVGLDHPTAFDARGIEQPAGSLDPQQTQRSRNMNLAVSGIMQQRRLMAASMLRNLSEGTGGTASIDTTNLSTALDRIADESGHYYMLGYVSTDTRRDGRYRKIDVRLKRPGLLVRARHGYAAPDDEADRKAQGKTKAGGPQSRPLAELIRRPIATAGLPLRVHAVALPALTDNVCVVVELGAEGLTFETRGDERTNVVDVAIVPVTAGGEVMPAVDARADLIVPAAQAELMRVRGLRLVRRTTLAPGRYQLRVAARESAGGTSGAVIYDLAVPEPRGLQMSALLVSSGAAGQVPSSARDELIETALGGRPPTTARVFGDDDVLSAYAELVDVGALTSRDIELTTIIRDAEGRRLLRSPQPKANAGRPAGASFAYVVDLPLKALAPGHYTLRVEARADGLRVPLAREVAFDVRNTTP